MVKQPNKFRYIEYCKRDRKLPIILSEDEIKRRASYLNNPVIRQKQKDSMSRPDVRAKQSIIQKIIYANVDTLTHNHNLLRKLGDETSIIEDFLIETIKDDNYRYIDIFKELNKIHYEKIYL